MEKQIDRAKIDEIRNASEVKALFDVRKAHADRAKQAQDVYKRNGVAFIVAGAVATIAGALILLGTGGEGAKAAQEAAARGEEILTPATLATVQGVLSQVWFRSLLFVIEVLALGYTAYAAEVMRSSKADTTWVNERRAAEAGRITLFDAVMATGRAKDGDAPQGYEVAAFDHFVSDQLDKQIGYHADKEAKASEGAWRTVQIGAVIAALTAAVGATGTIGQWWIVIGAFVGVVAPVLMHGLTKYREMKMDREQTIASAETWAVLRKLRGGVDAARAELAQGDGTKASALIDATHAAMKAENEAWTPTKPPV